MSNPNSKLKNRRIFSAEFKARVVLELVRSEYSLAEASAKYDIKDTVLSRWKQEFLERAASVFGSSENEIDREKIAELERIIGQQAVELTLLKKASSLLQSRKGSGS